MSFLGEGHVKSKSWHAADRAMCIHLLANLRSAAREAFGALGFFGEQTCMAWICAGTLQHIYLHIDILSQTQTANASKILCQTHLRSPKFISEIKFSYKMYLAPPIY